MERRPGFKLDDLRARYDVESFQEDPWHSYSGSETARFVAEWLRRSTAKSRLLLNAGSGVHPVEAPQWEEISVDLFAAPLRSHRRTVRASIEELPFPAAEFGAVICVGEVLGYCDPAKALAEFARVLEIGGVLVCDFGSSRSVRHWFTPTHHRAADLVTDTYNGSPERIWVYDPDYVRSVLRSLGFRILQDKGTHTWSALARRIGVAPDKAVWCQRKMDWIPIPRVWADVTTIAAYRCANAPR